MRALAGVILVVATAACAHREPETRTVYVQERAAPRPVRHAVSGGHDWEALGARWVDGRVDRDRIQVGRDDGRFRTLMLSVRDSAVEIYDVRVVFADGSEFTPRTRLVFGENSRSGQIDLPGGDRVVRFVDFRYGNLPGGGRARVELWGR
jgi:hypothetical protein